MKNQMRCGKAPDNQSPQLKNTTLIPSCSTWFKNCGESKHKQTVKHKKKPAETGTYTSEYHKQGECSIGTPRWRPAQIPPPPVVRGIKKKKS